MYFLGDPNSSEFIAPAETDTNSADNLVVHDLPVVELDQSLKARYIRWSNSIEGPIQPFVRFAPTYAPGLIGGVVAAKLFGKSAFWMGAAGMVTNGVISLFNTVMRPRVPR